MKRFLIILVALAIGVGIVGFFVSRIEPPARIEAVEASQSVRYIEAQPVPLTITASGFGTAAPASTWTAVSNVKGEIVFTHPDLESGATLAAGTLLLEFDSSAYELALREADAEIASIEAEIAQLKQEAVNSEALLELERQRLELTETSLERSRQLVESGSAPQASLDTQLRATLQQRQAVQALLNQQNIIPIQLNRLDTQIERALAKRAQVESDLADTKIVAPFDLRVGEVSVELYENINPGQNLFSADGVVSSEVVLQVPMPDLRRVMAEIPDTEGDLNIASVGAVVRLVGDQQSWEAVVVRIANGIDPATRTVRVVLSIPQPEGPLDPLTNPLLPKGMFVEGVLSTPEPVMRLVVPQSAIHEGWAYLVDENDRLARRQVETDFRQGELAIISAGLEPGDRLVVDDVIPAIEGLLLAAERDTGTEQALASEAAGEKL